MELMDKTENRAETGNDTVFGEVLRGTSRKQIVASEYKGKRYLQIREKWRKTESDSEWLFSKKIVSFDSKALTELIQSLKIHGIKSFDDLLLMFNPEEEKK